MRKIQISVGDVSYSPAPHTRAHWFVKNFEPTPLTKKTAQNTPLTGYTRVYSSVNNIIVSVFTVYSRRFIRIKTNNKDLCTIHSYSAYIFIQPNDIKKNNVYHISIIIIICTSL